MTTVTSRRTSLTTSEIRIVETGCANRASLDVALRRIGLDPEPIRSPEEIDRAERVVLPGVGSFGAAAARLTRDGTFEALGRRIARGAPTLAVCIGLQLLAESSEEADDDGSRGLAVLPVRAERFRGIGQRVRDLSRRFQAGLGRATAVQMPLRPSLIDDKF